MIDEIIYRNLFIIPLIKIMKFLKKKTISLIIFFYQSINHKLMNECFLRIGCLSYDIIYKTTSDHQDCFRVNIIFIYLFIYLFVCLFVIIIIIIYFLWYRKDNSDCKMSISVTYPQLYYISELIIHE